MRQPSAQRSGLYGGITASRPQYQIRQNADALAHSIVLEQEKTLADAHGDVLRGLQVIESSIGITSNIVGEKLEASKDLDTKVRKLPLGVCTRKARRLDQR